MSDNCERCTTEPADHVVVLGSPEGCDYGTHIQFWCDECIEGVVFGLDDPDLARRYSGHRPLRIPFRP